MSDTTQFDENAEDVTAVAAEDQSPESTRHIVVGAGGVAYDVELGASGAVDERAGDWLNYCPRP